MKQTILKSFHVTRNDTAERWAEIDPVLMKGEFGVELDTGRQKVGDGKSTWNNLPYIDNSIYDAIADEKVRAENAEKGLSDRLNSANKDISKVAELLKSGTAIDDIKTALATFGEGYADLYSVARTLHTFLTDADATNDAINRWQEIESFLNGITDTQTLTGLIEELQVSITKAYESAIADEKVRAENAEKGLSDRLNIIENFIGDSASKGLTDKVNEVIDERLADNVYILDGGNAAGHTT